MNVSKKVSQPNDPKPSIVNKAISLNPNAAEFVPFSLRQPSISSPSGSTVKSADSAVRFGSSDNFGKAVLGRSESSVSNVSDEEARQFWNQQLPDDITPDFKIMSEDDSQGLGGLSLSGLSMNDNNDVSRFSASSASGFALADQQPTARHMNGVNFGENVRYAGNTFGDDQNSGSFVTSKLWDKQFVNGDQLLGNGRELHTYNGGRRGLMNDMLPEHPSVDETDINLLEFLASQFPGFAAESLAQVYFANGFDLNLTVEMLTQLELQVDVGNNQNVISKAVPSPNLNSMEFPALSANENPNGLAKYNGDDLQQTGNSYRTSDQDHLLMFKSGSSFGTRGASDFAAAVRKMVSPGSGMWKYERNGSPDSAVGSSRTSHVLASSFNVGPGRGGYSDRLPGRGMARGAPLWVETGDAVANMYSELREEARDHARVRNAYLEQARQAYLIGNKALAKELSAKGQMHNMQMKAAHGKAQESIYRQRNPEILANGRGIERMIDLHGLHVNEAMHVLKHELNTLRNTARIAEQRLQVYILVGTGHHTKGSRTPARLPIAIQRYLLEEEGLDFTEPQPGLLRVVIH